MLTIQTGPLAGSYENGLRTLVNNRAISRLWNRDISLWPDCDSRRVNAKELLGWLDLVDGLHTSASQVADLAENLANSGITDIVFLAISSSALAADLLPAMGLPTRGASFHVLDQTDPHALRDLTRRLDFSRTLFLVASKSGKNLEMHALLLYLQSRVKAAGVVSPGTRFIAITEDGSYLATIAKENRFLASFTEPHGFRGRFSGVQHYGLLLGGLCGLDGQKIHNSIQKVREQILRASNVETNSAAQLAAFFSAMADTGFNRLVFRVPPTLVPLAQRLGHVISASSCKDGTGILPFMSFHLTEGQITELPYTICDLHLGADGPIATPVPQKPSLLIRLSCLEEIPSLLFQWEVATCLACHLLDVNPFQDPDYRDARDASIRFINQHVATNLLQISQPRIVERNIQLYVEGELRHDLSSLSLEHALASFFSLCEPHGYCSFLSYVWALPEIRRDLRKVVANAGASLGVPSRFVSGPRYLHLTGQCYKGGPRGGIALILTCDPVERIEVPGADYTFGDLSLALALGDFEAMVARNRPVVRLHLTGDPAQAVSQLVTLIERALKLCHRSRL